MTIENVSCGLHGGWLWLHARTHARTRVRYTYIACLVTWHGGGVKCFLNGCVWIQLDECGFYTNASRHIITLRLLKGVRFCPRVRYVVVLRHRTYLGCRWDAERDAPAALALLPRDGPQTDLGRSRIVLNRTSLSVFCLYLKHLRADLNFDYSFYKVVQIWPGRFVCKQVTVCPGHIWTTL
jgi:hypothetical protein